jgi:hypothetical protein
MLAALWFQPKEVTGIEINPILVHDLAQKKLKKFISASNLSHSLSSRINQDMS